ncbi:type 1 glutamine amidotransferase domain-containing protein [Nocardioides sp. STR2]|uniref:Type 1 glutamine amidotransferase domain-containing protein n=1 Tax=Nocardioides pini TaxID=2975053 RepID=A0ABT4CH64_9ACTN|nr:type 1 glutamine amidotransferase domain-containing protein [Nocardioides pini]MCY4727242.1 type 1 glutamine amidotransferase domain-containing protein [Nocardioides pini]
MPKILTVLTGADHWTLSDGTKHPTGFWAEELLAPLAVFDEAGIDVDLASPGGRTPVVDEGSLDPGAIGEEESAKQRAALDALQGRLASTLVLADVDLDDYDAVFVPGGHGPMEDLAVDDDLGRVLVTMLDAGKVVSSVCHGPAGLLPATREDGSWLFEGRELTAFTDAEEKQAGLADKAPWLLESRLRESGASFSSGEPWAPFVVVDGRLVTGQNPASSTQAAQEVVKLLQG